MDVAANLNTGNAPLEVQFNPNITGGTAPYAYAWSFGDGGTSNEEYPIHTYMQSGTYSVTLTVTDSDNKNGAAATTITVKSASQAPPGVANIKMTNVFSGEDVSPVEADIWYDLILEFTEWNSISYADVWINHESNIEGTVANRGGTFRAESNYKMSYSIATNQIWAAQTEGEPVNSNITGLLGLYIDDDSNEYVQNSAGEWAKARFKLLNNALPGNWTINAYVVDNNSQKSDLLQKQITVLSPGNAPTAMISLRDSLPVSSGIVNVTLTTSTAVVKSPGPLYFTDAQNNIHSIALEEKEYRRVFTGAFVIDKSVAEGIGSFSLAVGALIDEAGRQGNLLTQGTILEIDRTPPARPKNIKAKPDSAQ